MDPCLAQLNERLESAVDGMFRPPIELASPFGGRGGRVTSCQYAWMRHLSVGLVRCAIKAL
jgi:hypothetical protein